VASTEFCAPTQDVIRPVASNTASFVFNMTTFLNDGSY
jgi:hypothetical protein